MARHPRPTCLPIPEGRRGLTDGRWAWADLRSRSPRDLFAMEPRHRSGAATGWHWSPRVFVSTLAPECSLKLFPSPAARFLGTGFRRAPDGMALADRWPTAGVALPSAAV